jgi:hypothetical protein
MSDPKDNVLLKYINHPLFYLVGSIIGLIGFVAGWIKDETYLYLVFGAAIYGTFTWFRNRRKTN